MIHRTEHTMIDKMIEKLHGHGKSKCDLGTMQEWSKTDTYSELVNVIAELEQRNIIKPVMASGLNGKNPPLYQAYHILTPRTDDSSLLAELNAMHYWISTEHLRKHPKKYSSIRHVLLPLSEYLKSHEGMLDSPMSENERAYSIWGDEKFLDVSAHIGALKECGIWERLHTYPTPEPFFEYRKISVPQNVLVIENKDSWFSMRKMMIETDISSLFQIRFDCLIYGEGNKITQTNSSLEQYLNIDHTFSGTVYYWGDLDPEGIGFYLSAKSVNSGLNFRLCVPAYQEMLTLFEKRLFMPHTPEQYRVRKKQKYPANADAFYQLFPERTGSRIQELMEAGYYIPQEILNYQMLKQFFRGECTV